jgi:NAD(P)-dependent dehydrogenase (short-subunit alcohol dehydrogenase family)
MKHPLGNQVALVTGAGSGIGRQLCIELARQGAVIAAVDLHAGPLEALITQLKTANCAGAWAVADVTDRAALGQAVEAFTRRLGPVELLVANAGIGVAMPAVSFRAEDVERQVSVNLIGVANSIAAVLPGMLERRRGHLVAVSSLASYRGMPLMSGYCASKAGVNALMDSLRAELRPHGIRCTTLCPGWVRTPLTESLPDPKPAMMEVEEAARRMVRAIVRRRAFCAFPFGLRLTCALFRWLPPWLGDRVIRVYMRRVLGPR